MDLELLITLVAAGIINTAILALMAAGFYYLLKKKRIKKVLRKIFKI